MKKHLLDNPVWAALTTGNAQLSAGNQDARYFPKEVSPFAGVSELTPPNFRLLFDIVPFSEAIALFTDHPALAPDPWHIVNRIDGYQMLFPEQLQVIPFQTDVVRLTSEHIPQMLELTRLTKPGPFSERTIEFGNYEGVMQDGRIAAMAGWRLHSGDHIEISAVCTHPAYQGKGYARRLISSQIHQIQQAGKQAYLHVRADNTRAIEVYKDIGFQIRKEMIIYILRKS